MKSVFSVIQFGESVFHSDDVLVANEFSRLTSYSKVVQLKMNSRLYQRAYRFLKRRAKGLDMISSMKPIESLASDEKQLVQNFLSYNHNIKFI